ncbi:MAG: hypothetical protein HZA35_01445 [Parcubacteria group bacterium]|nr:hypothetical protein [Parcubacteria group bacterium]
MVQLISMGRGTAQVVVTEGGGSKTFHLQKKRGGKEDDIFKTMDTVVREKNEAGEVVEKIVPGHEFDLTGLFTTRQTPPGNATRPLRLKGKRGGGAPPKKSRAEKKAEKDAANKKPGKGNKER